MPAAEPTVAAGYADALLRYATDRGADGGSLLEAAAIAPDALADPDGRLPLARFAALVRAARAATGDPALALRFGSEEELADSSVVGLIGRCAETIAEAFALLNRYGRLLADVEHDPAARFQLVKDADGDWAVDTRRDPAAWPELTECTFARLVAVGRQLLPDRDYVEEIHFAYPPPPHAAEYEKILRVPVLFGTGTNRLKFDPLALERRLVVKQPRYALSILGSHAEMLLARLDERAPVRRQVEEVLAAAPGAGQWRQDHVADRLGLSRRTLQRRLEAEGTTFDQVLEELRRRLAAGHLAAGRSVKQTAHLLGFSDPAAFSRAFKRWTGTSPNSIRRPGA